VVSTAVSQNNLDSTICRSGYTKTVRPPESRTGAFKKKIMVAYREPGVLGDYELDQLVSLELGGSNDAGNLWPERNDHPGGGRRGTGGGGRPRAAGWPTRSIPRPPNTVCGLPGRDLSAEVAGEAKSCRAVRRRGPLTGP